MEHNLLTAHSDHLTIFDATTQDWQASRLPGLKEFQVADQTGAATYSFPIQVPPGPGSELPTDYLYTGQRDAGWGLYHFKAR